jgi:cytochrome c556
MTSQRRTLRTALLAAIAGTIAVVPGPSTAQTPRTRTVMRTKLAHTQKILEALMTSDYAALERESAALSRVTETPEWSELKTSELYAYTKRFLDATHQLADAARQRDLDRAAKQYGELTTACYECHKYRKGIRIAG